MTYSYLGADYLETSMELLVVLSPANGFTPSFFPPDPVLGEQGFLIALPVTLTDEAGNEAGRCGDGVGGVGRPRRRGTPARLRPLLRPVARDARGGV
jgi:hypothetical protein